MPKTRPVLIAAILALSTLSTAAATQPVVTAAVDVPVGQEFAIGMGAVDPVIRELHESQGTPIEPPGDETRRDRVEYLRFYPERLQVHAGDRVRFRHEGFHSAVFVEQVDDGPSFFRRDEVEGVSAVDDRGRLPTDPSCAVHAVDVDDETEPCVLSDPQTRFSTGWNSARVQLELPPGIYTYVCGIHAGMVGEIEVVPAEQPIASPAEVEVERERRVAEDTANAEEVIAAGQTPGSHVDGDIRVWTVKAGDFTPDGRVAILRFLPSDLTVEEGDEVRYVVPDGPGYEVHTASFPSDAYPLDIATYLSGACDPDDPRTGAPGVPATVGLIFLDAVSGGELGCPEPLELEMHFQPYAWRHPLRAPGDRVATPRTLHDSGLMSTQWTDCKFSCDPWTQERFPSEAQVSFGMPATYPYVCIIHADWGMTAAVTVTPS